MNTPTTPPDAVQMPPLPEMAAMASIQGHDGSEYRLLSTSYEPGFAMFSEKHMHAYAQAYAAQRTAELEAKLAAAEKRVAELTSENANLLHALKAELQGQTFMGEPFIPALTTKEQQ